MTPHLFGFYKPTQPIEYELSTSIKDPTFELFYLHGCSDVV